MAGLREAARRRTQFNPGFFRVLLFCLPSSSAVGTFLLSRSVVGMMLVFPAGFCGFFGALLPLRIVYWLSRNSPREGLEVPFYLHTLFPPHISPFEVPAMRIRTVLDTYREVDRERSVKRKRKILKYGFTPKQFAKALLPSSHPILHVLCPCF